MKWPSEGIVQNNFFAIDASIYVSRYIVQGNTVILHLTSANGVEGFFQTYGDRKRSYYFEGEEYYRSAHSAAHSVPGRSKEMLDLVVRGKIITERSSDFQSIFYHPELLLRMAPEWCAYFQDYITTLHGEQFTTASGIASSSSLFGGKRCKMTEISSSTEHVVTPLEL